MTKETVCVENMGGGYFEASDIFEMIRKLTNYLEEINASNEYAIEELEDEKEDLELEVDSLADENEGLKDQIEEMERVIDELQNM